MYVLYFRISLEEPVTSSGDISIMKFLNQLMSYSGIAWNKLTVQSPGHLAAAEPAEWERETERAAGEAWPPGKDPEGNAPPQLVLPAGKAAARDSGGRRRLVTCHHPAGWGHFHQCWTVGLAFECTENLQVCQKKWRETFGKTHSLGQTQANYRKSLPVSGQALLLNLACWVWLEIKKEIGCK